MMFGRGFYGASNCFGLSRYGFYGMIPMMILLVVLVTVGIIVIVKVSKRSKNESSAYTILQDRFAKGEISEEEYLAKKSLLK